MHKTFCEILYSVNIVLYTFWKIFASRKTVSDLNASSVASRHLPPLGKADIEKANINYRDIVNRIFEHNIRCFREDKKKLFS